MSKGSFTAKVLIVALITLSILFVVWYGQVVLLVFAAVLVAVFIEGLVGLLQSHTRLGRIPHSHAISLAVVYTVLFLTMVGVAFALGPSVISQSQELRARLPDAFDRLVDTIRATSMGAFLLENIPEGSEIAESLDFSKVLSYLSMFSGALGFLSSLLIIFVLGIYMTVNPRQYRSAILHLVPKERRGRIREVMMVLGRVLRRWLAGRLASMVAVGILTTVGLLLLGIPLAAILGILSGILTFIPVVGPILSSVPAILLGLLVDPIHGVYVLALYLGVQFLESYFITPVIEQQAVSLPPALLILAQITMGYFFGFWGIILATPFAVFVIVLVEMLYIEDVLGDEIIVIGLKGDDEEGG